MKLKIHKYVGTKQYATEQPMGQREIRKYVETKEKWKYRMVKLKGCSKISSEKEVSSDKCLYQKSRKIST